MNLKWHWQMLVIHRSGIHMPGPRLHVVEDEISKYNLESFTKRQEKSSELLLLFETSISTTSLRSNLHTQQVKGRRHIV